MAEATHGALEAEMREIFVPFRGFCTRNGVIKYLVSDQHKKLILSDQRHEQKKILNYENAFCFPSLIDQVHVSELVLEEADVSKALIEFITVNKIQSIALGASNRNAFTK